MKTLKGSLAIVIVTVCLTPTNALPDFLAPFRSMLGMKGDGSSHSPYHSKPGTSSKAHSASLQSNKHHGVGSGGHHGPQSQNDDPFKGGFGFGSGAPQNFEGPSYHNSQGPSSSPHASPVRGGGSFGPSRPGPNQGRRPVRQQPGNGFRPNFPVASGRPLSSAAHPEQSYAHLNSQQQGFDHQPRPEGPPSDFRGQGHDDDSTPYEYQDGPMSSPFGGDESPSSPHFQSSPSGRRPHSSSSLYGQGPRGPPRGGGLSPFSGSNDAPEEAQGPGFSGFGSFPDGDEQDSPPPRGDQPSSGYGGRRPSQSSSPQASSPYLQMQQSWQNDEQSSSRPTYPQQNGQDEAGPSSGLFSSGGLSDYPEQYEGASRGARQPQTITGNDVSKYPPQITEDDEPQGPPQGEGYNWGGGSGAPWGQTAEGGGGAYGAAEESQPSLSLAPANGAALPSYQAKRHYPSSAIRGHSTYPKRRYQHQQQPSESVQYGKPIMMGSSSEAVPSTVKAPRVQKRKRFSAKIPAPNSSLKIKPSAQIVPLVSPRDPDYEASSLSSVSAAWEPETAATEHGHGGFEGLSPNGDRILYHVAGHQGPESYRFGYDTGKGYNRLFRFEEKDGKGYVKGKYGFFDKHGKLQVIKYEAHPKHGFHAERGNTHLLLI